MKIYFLFALFFSISLPAFAGPETNSISKDRPLSFGKEEVRSDRVLKKSDMDKDQQAFVWEVKTVDVSGYLRVKTTLEYLNLPTTISKHPGFKRKKDASVAVRGDLEMIGRFDEDANRVTWVFSHSNSDILLTVW